MHLFLRVSAFLILGASKLIIDEKLENEIRLSPARGESENKLEKACVQEITGSKWLKEEPFPLAKSELRGKRKNNFILYLYAGKESVSS